MLRFQVRRKQIQKANKNKEKGEKTSYRLNPARNAGSNLWGIREDKKACKGIRWEGREEKGRGGSGSELERTDEE